MTYLTGNRRSGWSAEAITDLPAAGYMRPGTTHLMALTRGGGGPRGRVQETIGLAMMAKANIPRTPVHGPAFLDLPESLDYQIFVVSDRRPPRCRS